MERVIPISQEKEFLADLISGEFLPIYKSWRTKSANGAVYAALTPTIARANIVETPSWQLHIGDGIPCFSSTGFGSEHVATYHPTTEDGIVPLAFMRDGQGILEPLPEPLQEFVLYHDLHSANDGKEFLKIHPDGTTEIFIRILSKEEILFRTEAVIQFQAAKQMDLMIQIDSVQFVENKSDIPVEYEYKNQDIFLGTYPFDTWSNLGYRALGKIIFPARSISHSGIWPFEVEPKVKETFAITNNHGEQIEIALESGQELDSNDYLRSLGRHYLEIVQFDKNVLNRYIANPDIYEIGDGFLKCGSLWSVSIDNDNPNGLFIFLGDIVRDLPPTEWKFWKPFNKTSPDNLSETFYRRSILGKETEPNRPDLRLRANYSIFQQSWYEQFTWMLFLPLSDEDSYVLKTLNLPNTENTKGFDDFFLYLGKVFPNSLNVRKISELAEIPKNDDRKPLVRFQCWLQISGLEEHEFVFNTFHSIQWIRSNSSAHRKNFQLNDKLREKFGLPIGYELAEKLCNDANESLNLLNSHFL